MHRSSGLRAGPEAIEGDEAAQRIVDFLRALGASELPHAGGRSLLDHLLGTYWIVRRWRQPQWLQHAALIHSVYGTDAYQRQLLDPGCRDRPAGVAGERAERLAHGFARTPRRLLFAGTHRWLRDLPSATGARDQDQLTREELDALVLLHLANIAEQSQAPDGSPGRWLMRARELAGLLPEDGAVTAPLFAEHLATFSAQQESLTRRAYARGAAEQEERRLGLAAASCPVVPEPCVWLAYSCWRRADLDGAREWSAEARRRLLMLGTAWDKRLTYEQWQAVLERLEGPAEGRHRTARAVREPWSLHAALLDEAAAGGHRGRPRPARRPAAIAPASAAAGRRRFQRYVEALAVEDGTAERSPGAIYPDLPVRAWHDPRDFPLVGYLESNFAAIRAEILALDAARFQRESEPIPREGDWDVAFLYERGRRRQEVCAACPVSTRGVESYSTVRTLAGLSYVSRMRPATHIAPHRGPTNLRVRCHLGIQVPAGDCALRVGSQTRRWRQGKCLVFDDLCEHEAWNHTPEDRIVLIVDLWHPALSPVEVELLQGLHRYAQFHAGRLSRYWAVNARAVRGSGLTA